MDRHFRPKHQLYFFSAVKSIPVNSIVHTGTVSETVDGQTSTWCEVKVSLLCAMDAIDFHSPTLQWEPNAPDTWKLLPDGGLWVKPMAQRDFWSHPVALETFKGGSNV